MVLGFTDGSAGRVRTKQGRGLDRMRMKEWVGPRGKNKKRVCGPRELVGFEKIHYAFLPHIRRADVNLLTLRLRRLVRNREVQNASQHHQTRPLVHDRTQPEFGAFIA